MQCSVTKVMTFENRPMYIPNSAFADITVENLGRMLNRRIETTVGLRYEDADKIADIVDDSYHDGSYCPPDRVISGTTATHGLCTDYLGQNEPAPVFGDYVATRPSTAHSEQYLLSSGVALTSQ